MSDANTSTPTLPDLCAMARAAGKSGVSYPDWTSSDELFRALDAYDAADVRFDVPACEEAFRDGQREHRIAGGWRQVWTTAPVAYDQFGTQTIEDCGSWRGKSLRKVLLDPNYAEFQIGRYGSGLHGAWDEDPRLEEARIQEQIENDRREQEERDRKRAEGLEWLKSADVDKLLEDEDEATMWTHGLRWSDLRAEQRRRRDERETAERAAKWAKCRAAFEDGVTLIDEGTPGFRGIRGRDADAWRSCVVKPHYEKMDDPDEADVVGEGGVRVGSLEYVADKLASGEFRIAGPEEHVPPRAVLKRIGCPWKEVARAELGGSVAWAGKPMFAYDCLVLDDSGKIVRKVKLQDAALAAHYELMYRR